jgi:hypothetical protein
MTYPSFASGEVLTAADMNAVGLWLIKTQTVGTGVSSVSVTGAFSADYDNYRITYTGGSSSAANADLSLQLNGATGSNYETVLFYANFGAAAVSCASTTSTSYAWAGQAQTNGNTMMVDLLKPFMAEPTRYSAQFWANGVGWSQGRHTLATSYTGFTVIHGGGTMTGGTIRVYGYKN